MELTSFPSFIKDEDFILFWEKYLNNFNDEDILSLYIHFPWCRSKCEYCVFGGDSFYNTKYINKYENAILRNLSIFDNLISKSGVKLDELYFGGGTSSLWSFESLYKMTTYQFYKKLPFKRMEIHPYDLNDELVDFYINTMKFDHISMGVESFDHKSNIDQKRIPTDVEKLKKYIDVFQKNGIYINLDIVALFNGDSINDWNIFKKDMDILDSYIKPDGISVYMNYRNANFYENSLKLRRFINEYIKNKYFVTHDGILSDNIYDVIKYSSSPYMLHTKEYLDFITSIRALYPKTDKYIDEIQNIIGFGGINNNESMSRTSDGYIIYGTYNEVKDDFTYLINKKEIINPDNLIKNELLKSTIQIGRYTVPSILNQYSSNVDV